MQAAPQTIPVSAARKLLLGGLGLLDPPARPASPDHVLEQIQRLGFVQLDSINIVERAHHHILWTRLYAYRTASLDALQSSGRVFEHWTHDASIIPTCWFPYWRRRFAEKSWTPWLRQQLGPRYRHILDRVLDRVKRDGPLRARDFEHRERKGGSWWDWKPAKTALEYWWWSGELMIRHRARFEKVYDLTARVLPEAHALPAPDLDAHADWACRMALDRLGVASPRELAGFWALVTSAQAAKWCAAAVTRGDVVPVRIGGKGTAAFAHADWRDRLARSGTPPPGMRVLSPFDPLIRDRSRCSRLFGFGYRFEAFVPEAKRRFGYYVLPILEGDRLVGRLDPKLDRDARRLQVRRVWWEPKIKATIGRRRALTEALGRYCELIGATSVDIAR